MGYFDDGSTLPPPFNLIISPKSIFYFLRGIKRFIVCCFCGGFRSSRHQGRHSSSAAAAVAASKVHLSSGVTSRHHCLAAEYLPISMNCSFVMYSKLNVAVRIYGQYSTHFHLKSNTDLTDHDNRIMRIPYACISLKIYQLEKSVSALVATKSSLE